jgi:SAM-dependent methyltransferase
VHYTSAYERDSCRGTDRYAHDPAARQRFVKLLEMIPPGIQSILDVGCGDGRFLKMTEELAPVGILAGLEHSRAAIENAVCKTEIHHCSIENMPFDDSRFHLVTAQEVIEHLPFGIYEEALSEIERVAREYILISVPYREKRIWIACEHCGCRFNPWGHLRTFELNTMQHLFKRYELIETAFIFVKQAIGKNLIWGIYKLLTGRQRPAIAFICPQCGFGPTNESGGTESARHARRKDFITRILPTRRVANNIICLYKRC